MPLTRVNTTRKSSRSPVPSSFTPTSSTSREFLPPSHYAAAGGFNIPNHSSPSLQNIEGYTAKKSRSSHQDAGRKHRRNGEESSNRSEYPGSGSQDPAAHLTGRSSRSGLAEMEPQLLPSLRDTIDRMTREPSGASPSYKPSANVSSTSIPERRKIPRQVSPEQRYRGTPSQGKHTNNQMFASYYSSAAIEESIASNVSQICSNQSTPTISNVKSPPKSALKSSLKATTTTAIKSPQSSEITRSPSLTGSSLRTMRSLTRKCSATLKSSFGSSKSSQQEKRKSRRDVSPPVQVSVEGVARDFGYEKYSGAPPANVERKSGIPRPRRYYHEDPQDSDLERRYENGTRNLRRLTVANAEVPASGSDSDADSRRNMLAPSSAKAAAPKSNYDKHVGLGLSLRNNPKEQAPPTWKYSGVGLQDTPNNVVQREKNLRFSLPASDSSVSKYSDSVVDSEHQSESSQNDSIEDDMSRFDQHAWSHNQRSSPVSLISSEHSSDQDTESEREGYSVRKPKTSEKRAIPNTAPTPAAVQGRVSQTAYKQYESEPSLDSRIFPSNLRELIKKRHSFVKTPLQESSSLSAKILNNQEEDELRSNAPIYQPFQDQKYISPRLHERQEKNLKASTSAAVLAGDHRSAAARERQAFGIPPSESDEIFDNKDDVYSHSGSEDRSNSTWEQDNMEEDSDNMPESRFLAGQETPRNEWQEAAHERTPRFSVIQPSLSASSVPDDVRSDTSWSGQRTGQQQVQAETQQEHRHMNNPSYSAETLPRTREAVIQEIFETEEILLKHLHICMRVFILPLRINNSRAWIAGVPPNVQRLLDWFDDILNLHEQVYQSLCCARDTMSPATDRVSESLRCFVLKGETYQPYLVRLADVSEEIVRCVADPSSDFGQFVSIQQTTPECEGWTLDRLLMLPVNRLAAYEELFAKLLDLTPKTHQDYLSTFSLSRSTDMLMKVMTEVKVREDEYNLLKAFSSRIQGMLSSTKLATRERRLLHSGPLSFVIAGLPDAASSKRDYQGPTGMTKRGDRGSKLMDAITITSSAFERSASDVSVSTTASSNTPMTGPVLPKSPSSKSSWLSRLPLRKRSKSKSSIPPIVENSPERRDLAVETTLSVPLKTVDVHAFVFSDLVLLAHPSSASGRKASWTLFDDLGIFRPLSIARIDSKGPGNDVTILSLEALDLPPECLNDNIDFRTCSFRTIDLRLPISLGQSPTEEDLNEHPLFQAWLSAFQQCMKTTLQRLTFIGHAHQQDAAFIGSDKVLDTYLAVSSLVASGLPIPRSPSGQISGIFHGKEDHAFGDEREERGWWSLRFQQISREFQRQDSLLSED
ncbi:hypothetical protein CPC08DRAFT_821396 [Agrocybe pediades]|nr:hypothetical protein CPC08DRAFT_821396 [Agrocybe pediades]